MITLSFAQLSIGVTFVIIATLLVSDLLEK